jgi:hypothetical protein
LAQVRAGEEQVSSGRCVKDEVVAKSFDRCLALYDALALESDVIIEMVNRHVRRPEGGDGDSTDTIHTCRHLPPKPSRSSQYVSSSALM